MKGSNGSEQGEALVAASLRGRPGRSPRLVVASLSAGALLAAGVLAAPLAGAVTVGSPQPEAQQFKLGYGGSTSLSGGVSLADGTSVLASLTPNESSIFACQLRAGDRSCHTRSQFLAGSGNSYGGLAVVSTGGENVTVLSQFEGTFQSQSFPILAWNSTNDGASFSGPVIVSTGFYGIDNATVVDGKIVISVEDPHTGLEVQAIDPTGNSVATTFATVSTNDNENDIVTNDNGNLLVGAENINAVGGTETDVFLASGTSNLNNSASYSQVGSFPKRDLDSLSGNGVLLGLSNSLTKIGTISFFDGSSFGSQFKVPNTVNPDDGYATMQQTGDMSGRSDDGTYNVFFEDRRNGYDLIEESTTNGTTWTPQTQFSSASFSAEPTPVLASTGAGFVFESGSGSLSQRVQPVLFPVSLTIKLKKSKIKTGQTTTITDTGESIGVQFNTVELQKKLPNGSWNNVASTTENIPGQFSFTVGTPGTYRAVDNTVPGYLKYGYSNSVTLSHQS